MSADNHEHTFADQLLARLRSWNRYQDQIISEHVQVARKPHFVTVDESLQALLPQEISAMYSHQALSLTKALRGENLTLATATASGKTLALALPARVRRTTQQRATMLCIAPTRALVEQWAEQLRMWNPGCVVETYTGDTPKHQRPKIRAKVQCLVTTPDMLHISILPYHTLWRSFFVQLCDVIIDESHIYCGIFGSHMSHILRRLQRVAAFYRKEALTILFASATISNPAHHAELLLGQPVDAITENGAPSGGRRIVFWQPSDDRGHSDEAALLMAFFLAQGVRSILFGQARQSVERMLRTVQRLLSDSLRRRVAAYRAGYLVEERHAMQQQLVNGELLGVVSTNALELGIDVGALDVSILDGFPGSIASFWQQAGRSGRRERSALTILVLREDALDQYFALHPEKLLERPAEQALVNVSNAYILPRHLLCAAYEWPLASTEIGLFGSAAQNALDSLVTQGTVIVRDNHYTLVDRSASPAYGISLRQAGERLTVLSRGKKLEETDMYHAMTECFPGAVYYSQGKAHIVEQLDLEQGEVHMFPYEPHFYTEPLIDTSVEIFCTMEYAQRSHAQLDVGDVVVKRHVFGFVKRHQQYRNVIDRIEFEESYEVPLETKALWIMVDDTVVGNLIEQGYDLAGSLHAAEHAMIALLPLFVLGDRRDVGGVSMVEHDQTATATIFIYDGIEGGVGYAEEAYHQFGALAQATLDTLRACKCEGGCYACIMSPKCGNQNRPLDKRGAIALLETLMDTSTTMSIHGEEASSTLENE